MGILVKYLGFRFPDAEYVPGAATGTGRHAAHEIDPDSGYQYERKYDPKERSQVVLPLLVIEIYALIICISGLVLCLIEEILEKLHSAEGMIEMGFGWLQAEAAMFRKIWITAALQRVREQIYLRLLLVDYDHLFNVMVHDHLLYLPLARLLCILA